MTKVVPLATSERRRSRRDKARAVRIATSALGTLALLLIWEGFVRWRDVPEYLLPAPSVVARTIGSNFTMLIYDTGVTALETIAGFFLAILAASLAAIIFAHNRVVNDVFMPYLVALKAVPLIAVAPLLVLWLGNGFLSKAVMAATIAFFPVVVNLAQGLREVPTEQLDLMRSLSATRWQTFAVIRVPNALPYFLAALKIASTLSVVGAIVAEFSGANRGIGYVILIAALRVDTPMLFSGIALAAGLGIVLYYALDYAYRRVVFWEPGS